MMIFHYFTALLFFIQLSTVTSQLTPDDTGRRCDAGFFDNGNLCKRCPAGTVSSSGSFQCTACSNGTFVGSSLEECRRCFPGEFVNKKLVCTDCPRGEYSDTFNSAKCTKCPPNTITNFEGAFEVEFCFGCSPGSAIGGMFSNSDRPCGLCTSGTFQDQDPGLDCKPCPPGTGSTDADTDTGTEDRSSVDTCKPCPPGTYSLLQYGSRTCTSCPKGSIAPTEKTAECTSCSPGSFAADGAMRCVTIDNGSDIICPSGTEKNGTECVSCPTGTVNMNNSQTECKLCRNGLIPSEENDRCVCPVGQIIDIGGKGCKKCPARSIKINETACRCKSPFISVNDDFLECACPYHFRRSGSNCVACNGRQLAQSVNLHTLDCTLCPEDTIFNPKSGKCDKCPPGTKTPFGKMVDSCKPCKNTFMRSGVLNCGCGPGTSLRGNACKKCPPGTASNNPFGCDECYAPQFSDVAGLQFCKKCPKGQRYDPSGTAQKKCPPPCPANSKPGAFECECNNHSVEKRVRGKLTACNRCPGKQRADTFRQKCVCKKGFSVEGEKCKKCPAGTFSRKGLKCKQCNERSFNKGRGNRICERCRPGSFSVFTGGKKCVFCKKGSFITKKGGCGRCKPGFRVLNGRCVKCINSISSGGNVAFCAPCKSGMVLNKNNSRCMMPFD